MAKSDVLDKRSQSVLRALRREQSEAATQVVPWFYDNMPEYYFKTHNKDEQIRHLHGIVSSHVTHEDQTVVLESPCGTLFTFITPGKWANEFLSVFQQFPEEKLQTLRVISSHDGRLRLSDLALAPQSLCDTRKNNFRKALKLMQDGGFLEESEVPGFRAFLRCASQEYVDKFEENRSLRHYKTYQRICGSDAVEVTLEKNASEGRDRIMVNMMEPPQYGLLLQIVRMFTRRNIDIDRAYADRFETPEGEVFLTSFYVSAKDDVLDPKSQAWRELETDLNLSKWRPRHELDVLADENGWSLRQVQLIHAACDFTHQFLSKRDYYAFTTFNLIQSVLRNRELAYKLVEYFETRFNPSLTADQRAKTNAAQEQEILDALAVMTGAWKVMYEYMLRFIKMTLKTNYACINRYGLSFRLDPQILDEPIDGEWPYGIYFFHTPHGMGFHVRFREMSRGGLRIVPTPTQARFELESNRLFKECAALARTQQDKNKDIPEGGSKGVLLLGPGGNPDRALKSMVNSLLDLILPGDNCPTCPEVVDYLGHQEIIYLGPDENITSDHINWIIEQAKRRGYGWPAAFMSSKPKTGISHKEFGVTSIGVIIFAEELLHHLGIDPTSQPFTVKFTGGPRGDVASNAMKFLMDKYGENARIVAVSDGSGAAFDPQGLDHGELDRMIEAEESIAGFNAKKLSKGGDAYVVTSKTKEGAEIRNELHNKAVADIFIPSGGRPDTIHEGNWDRFLQEDGTPSSMGIIEGANIFITPGARDKLQEAGVLIFQGSSANKTGVICSSYEILGGLTLTDEEFTRNKKKFVQGVLDILEVRARDEARLLLREYVLSGKSWKMTDISNTIAKEINSLADSIMAVLKEDITSVDQDPDLYSLLLQYCPPILAAKYADRVVKQVPLGHQLALLAHFISSRIVYGEGLGWFSKLIETNDVRDIVRTYLSEEKHMNELCASVHRSSLKNKDDLLRVLSASGRKFLTMEKLGLN